MESSNILVVEDDSSAAKMIMDVLESEGYAVFSASTKSVAVELASKTRPSLVYINAILADASGLEITRSIREIEELKDVPFIMLTEMQEEFNERYKSTYGIIGFLKKPVDESDLLSKTKSIVPLGGDEAGLVTESGEALQSQELDEADSGGLAAETFEISEEAAESDKPESVDKIKIKVKVSDESDIIPPVDEIAQPEEIALDVPVEGAPEGDVEENTVPEISGEDVIQDQEEDAHPLNESFVDTGRHDVPETEEAHPLDKGFVDTGRHDMPEAEEPHAGIGGVGEEDVHPLDKGFVDTGRHEPEDVGEEVTINTDEDTAGETAGGAIGDEEQVPRSFEMPEEETFEIPPLREESKAKATDIPAFDDSDIGETVIEDFGDSLPGVGEDLGIVEDAYPERKAGSKSKAKMIIFGSLGVILIAALTWVGLGFMGKIKDANERVSSDAPVQIAKAKPQAVEKETLKDIQKNAGDAKGTVPSVVGKAQADKAASTGKAIVEKEQVVTAKKDVKKTAPPKATTKAVTRPAARYSVQIGFFKDVSNAKSLLNKMKKKGYSASIKKDRYKNSTVYRVLIGKYSSRDTATRMVRKIKRVEKMDAALHKL